MRKSIDVRFIMPEDMDIEDLVQIIQTGAFGTSIVHKNLESFFQVELEEALIQDNLIILQEI